MQLTAIQMLLFLGGSAALLLWGARMVRTGFMRSFGSEIREGLASNLDKPIKASLAGFLSALVLQSSTAVAMLTTSFASANILPLATGLAIMLGADVGAAIVAQLLSFNIKAIWPLLMLVGYVMHTMFASKNNRLKQIGRILLGLGFLLLSLTQLSLVASQLEQSDLLQIVLSSLSEEPALAFLIAMIMTYISHSSLAMILLIASLASANIIDSNLVLPMVLGVNVGGAIPALVMNMNEVPTSKQIVFGNFLFRLVLALISLLLLDYLLLLFGPISEFVLANIGMDMSVFAHILFNLTLFVIFIFLLKPASSLLSKLFKEKAETNSQNNQISHLKNSALEMPEIALNLASRESLILMDQVEKMVTQSFISLKSRNEELRAETAQIDFDVETLSHNIKAYMVELTQQELNKPQGKRAMEIIEFVGDLDQVGQELCRNMLETICQLLKQKKRFSVAGMNEISEMHDYILVTMQMSAKVFLDRDLESARELIKRKDLFRDAEVAHKKEHLTRLKAGNVNALETSAFHLDILRNYKKINSLFSANAYRLLEKAGELEASRLRQ